MQVFVIGATGYIGGSVAVKLVEAGHHVAGLVRSPAKAQALRGLGVEPVMGTLAERAILAAAARRAEVIINAADSDNLYVVEAVLPAIAGTGKTFLHTSGTSVVADRAAGEPSDRIFLEETPFEPLPERLLRVAIDRAVLTAAHRGVRSIVLRPGLIYGRGRGLNPHSHQLPRLIGLAKGRGAGVHIGRGLNIWSHVHLDDVVDLYVRALAEAPAGSLFYVENGEASMKAVAEAIGDLLGFGRTTQPWPIADALREWGAAAYTSFGSNSRVRSLKARKMLGWAPQGPPLIDEIEHGWYRDAQANS
jgi:nucleoside-diphosphate-sugar epimerase